MTWRLASIGVLIAALGQADAKYDAWVARFTAASNAWFHGDVKPSTLAFMSDGFADEQPAANSCVVYSTGATRSTTANRMSARGNYLPTLSVAQLVRLNQLLPSLPNGSMRLPAVDRRLALRAQVKGADIVRIYDRGNLAEAIFELLEVTGCASAITPWVPVLPHQRQWTARALTGKNCDRWARNRTEYTSELEDSTLSTQPA